jgi:hypothetical protein
MDSKFFLEICTRVVALDVAIRFAGIADEHGTLLAVSERKGLKPLLNAEETAQYAITAVTRQYTRLRWQQFLGKVSYTCSHYEKLLRATIPIIDENNHLQYVLLLTLDVGTDNFHQIITKKVIPFVTENSTKMHSSKR